MKRVILFTLLISIVHLGYSQNMEELTEEVKIVCYSSNHNEGTKILHRDHDHKRLSVGSLSKFSTSNNTGATFEVTYNGFTEEAQIAFQAAVDIWASILDSDVVIRVEANWRTLDQGVLGSAIWGTAYRGFDGALENDTWYPVALAEKMAGRELNSPDDADLVANFNRDANWYLGTDGNTSATETDLVSVVLHELGHGLGFVDSYNINDNNQGTVGIQGFPFTFDRRVEDENGVVLTTLASTPDVLRQELTSNSVFFNSESAVANNGSKPPLYAPSTWSGGSSIAHLDEGTFPAGDPNSLMTPQIGRNEVIHDPGQITLDMFSDMGWEYTYIENVDRPNSDIFDADVFPVSATVRSDLDFDEQSVTLFYSTDGFQADNNEVQMALTIPQGPDNLATFSADIPSTKTEDQVYAYYITVNDTKGRTFSRPSLSASDIFLTFSTSQDTEAPEILHRAPNFIKSNGVSFEINANISDYLPVNAEIEYSINSGASQTAELVLTDRNTGLYSGTFSPSSLGLVDGDIFSYRIIATDISQNTNSSVFPTTGLIDVNVTEQPDAVSRYFTDFDDLAAATEDFQPSADFSIIEEEGFTSGALHSMHPYANGTGANNESNYTIELKFPITIDAAFPVMSFDEIALIEAGQAGSVFGDNNFFDYVIVEGSKDAGNSWQPLVDGYDNRSDADWAEVYNENINATGDSESVGDASLYRNREINMLENGNFAAGDEILIRFRLFADEAAFGWGWVIDNLKIQIDDEGPSIIHRHLDYASSLDDIIISARVNDNVAVDSVGLLIRVNGQEQDPIELTAQEGENYSINLDISSLQTGDLIEYRIGASDVNSPDANSSVIPNDTDFIQVPIISFGSAVNVYENDFNTASDDFVGNFYSIDTPSDFSDGAIHSAHPYPIGFGILGTGTFTYTLKTPIRVDEERALVIYDEVVLVDPVLDYTALEASKDGGVTWFEIERYGTNTEPDVWLPAYQNGDDGSSSLYREHRIEMTQSPQISDGDEVLLRFRIERRGSGDGWGWAIDNLRIQTEIITSIPGEIQKENTVSVYPNPIKDNRLTIVVEGSNSNMIDYSIFSINGELSQSGNGLELNRSNEVSIDLSNLKPGLFLLNVFNGEISKVIKVLKTE